MVEVWSTVASLITGRNAAAACGYPSAGLCFGGGTSGGATSASEEYNGAVWTAGGAMSITRVDHSGCGTLAAALCVNGYSGGYLSSCEEYDGTSWSTGGSTSTARRHAASCGSQSAGLCMGGYTSGTTYIKTSEEYDGTSWSAGGSLVTANREPDALGTQTAGLCFGGYISGNSHANVTEEYNGTSWSSGGTLNTGRTRSAGAGTQTDGICYGGSGSSTAYVTSTEGYNGTSWTNGASLVTGVYYHTGGGTSTSALAIGGNTESFGWYNPLVQQYGEPLPAPTVSSIDPTSRTDDDPTSATVTGSDFIATPGVSVGATACTDVVVVDGTELTCTIPSGIVTGLYDVVVTNPDSSYGTLANGFEVDWSAPTVTGISPDNRTGDGPTSVTITGTNFYTGATATVGGITLDNIVVVSDTSITGDVPTGYSPGTYDVVVTNADSQYGTKASAFTISWNPPTVNSISPNGRTGNGTTGITITGTDFYSGAVVRIDTTELSDVVVVSGTSITATVPADLMPGSYDISVENTDTQVGTLSDAFTVTWNAPTVTDSEPIRGDVGVETVITITGTGYFIDVTVHVGDVLCTDVLVSDTEVTATVPGTLADGIYDVKVTNPDGQYGILADGFTAGELAPVLTNVYPASRDGIGSDYGYCDGENFRDGATVKIGDYECTGVDVYTGIFLTMTIPSNIPSGIYDATITNDDGKDDTLADAFSVYINIWTTNSDMLRSVAFTNGCGYLSAGLGIGGKDDSAIYTEVDEYNGTSWTSYGNVITGVCEHIAVGTELSAYVYACLLTGSYLTRNTYRFDGVAWSVGPLMNTNRRLGGGYGTPDSCISIGGLYTAGDVAYYDSTEEFNGTTWSIGETYPIKSYGVSGYGSLVDGYSMGGNTSTVSGTITNSSSMYNFNGTSWTALADMVIKRHGHGSAAMSTGGMCFSGDGPETLLTRFTEKYDETWSIAGANLVAKQWTGSFGSSSVVNFGGVSKHPDTGVVTYYATTESMTEETPSVITGTPDSFSLGSRIKRRKSIKREV